MRLKPAGYYVSTSGQPWIPPPETSFGLNTAACVGFTSPVACLPENALNVFSTSVNSADNQLNEYDCESEDGLEGVVVETPSKPSTSGQPWIPPPKTSSGLNTAACVDFASPVACLPGNALNVFSTSVNSVDNQLNEYDCESEDGLEGVVVETPSKPSTSRNTSKRSRAAEVYNLSEKQSFDMDVVKKMSGSVNQKLADLSETSNKPFIFRVHQRLRKQNEEAYEPELISIGPYHNGKKNLKKMEKYKLIYLQGILDRRGEASAERYIAALKKFVEEARDCYAEPICMNSDDFLEMMLLDGCFIIEFLRKSEGIVDILDDDHIFSMGWYHAALCKDLLLLENQLPFFILESLFDMTKQNRPGDELIYLSISCLSGCFEPAPKYLISLPRNKAFHLLMLMHESWFSSFSKPTDTKKDGGCQSRCIELKEWVLRRKEREVLNNMEFIKSVRELKEYGIKFQKAEEFRSLLDITFENGIMKIPTLTVHDATESMFRNLIAYERYEFLIAGYSSKVVTNYTIFIDCLINSSQDVQILCDEKIITNWLGSNENVSNIFDGIGDHVFFFPKEFSYREIFRDVNEHCSRQWNSWIPELKIKYFQSPWSTISFLAAFLFLLLTLTQTIVAIVQVTM